MKKLLLAAAIAAAAAASTGCSTVQANADADHAHADVQSSYNAKLNDELNATRSELQSTRTRIAELEAQRQLSSDNSASSGLLPPNAEPGICYARLFTPATYITREEKRLAKEASEQVTVIPASYKWVEEQVKVNDAHEHTKLIPATYKWVEDQVLVEPERTEKALVSAAVFKTVTEKVIDKPAHFVWKKGRGPLERIDSTTGEIMCRVEVPATYRTISRQELVSPAEIREVSKQAVYKTVKRRVIDKEAHTVVDKHAAEYKTVKVRKLIEAEKIVRLDVPAEYQTVTFNEKQGDEKLEWKTILCETNTTPNVVVKLQKALQTKGYKPGPIDGVVGVETMAAVNRFQKDSGLASGQLSTETLRSLGVL